MKDVQQAPKTGILLRGLRLVRQAVGHGIKSVSEATGIHREHVARLERLEQGSREATLLKLCNALACSPADLLFEPTPMRLAELRVAQAQAELAKLDSDLNPEVVAVAPDIEWDTIQPESTPCHLFAADRVNEILAIGNVAKQGKPARF